jgi:UDP-N-acetylmuramoylalanine--D-glutamate ligase
MDVNGLNCTVFGLGKSGLATVALLARRGAVVRASDQRPLAEIPEAEAALEAARARFVPQGPEAMEGAGLAILSPGVPPELPLFAQARAAGLTLLGDVEFASRFLRGRVLAITGSNGKTTTTALCGHLLKAAGLPVMVGGNIGTPLAAFVEDTREDSWTVLELSSFQTQMLTSMRIHVGVALNVTPDHLDRHGSFENYAAAKARMFAFQQPEDHAVLNHADPVTAGYAAEMRAQVRWFQTSGPLPSGFWFQDGTLYADGASWMPASEIPLRGLHNVENVLAAGCAAALAGVPLETARRAVATFPGVEHRIEFVRRLDGVEYFNDSKATNVDAAIKALESFDSGLWVILGGKDKGSDYTPLAPLLRARARGVLLIGAAAGLIRSHLEPALAGAIPLLDRGDLSAALREAHARARTGDTVLLAPACASFDQFTSYEHRGQVFKQLVLALEEPSR